ncbi:hypothetical protein DSM19430T_32600 [Desulfovibrio psychrotolerans]|uniref:Uncharacterized protein n=1 Tax=Desulfovibrio psychrotolerans TaxID=415242 RepID=A0A7J0BXZ8_9BACT|nr:hypothetical protein DSM19430T_32600 [Desulfovibrio psychrotolerans]
MRWYDGTVMRWCGDGGAVADLDERGAAWKKDAPAQALPCGTAPVFPHFRIPQTIFPVRLRG